MSDAQVQSTTEPASSTPSVANAVYQSTMANNTFAPSVIGLFAAIAALSNYASSLQTMQGSLATVSADQSQAASNLSDQENQVLQADYNVIESDPSPDATGSNADTINADRNKQINDDTAKYNLDKTTFDNAIATPQTYSEQFQTDAANLAQAISSLINNISKMTQIMGNLAQAAS